MTYEASEDASQKASHAILRGYTSVLRGSEKLENHLLEDDEQEDGFLDVDQFTICNPQRLK